MRATSFLFVKKQATIWRFESNSLTTSIFIYEFIQFQKKIDFNTFLCEYLYSLVNAAPTTTYNPTHVKHMFKHK